MGYLAAPVTFTSTFLLTVAALGAVTAILGGVRAGGRLILSPGEPAAVTPPSSVPARQLARVAFGTGWGLYGAAQILGGLAVSGFLRQAAGIVRPGGLALVVVGVVTARQRLKGSRRLVFALGLLAASEVAMAFLHPAPGAGAWFGAQALAIAAGVVLGTWLSEAFNVSIQFRFVTTFVALVVAVVVLISSAMTQVFAGNAQKDALQRAKREARSLDDRIDADAREAVSRALILAQLDVIRDAVSARSPQLASVAAAFQEPGRIFDSADFVAFLAPNGVLMAISNKAADGSATLDALDIASLSGTAVVGSALEGLQAGSVDLLGGKLVVVGAAPVLLRGSTQLAGVAAVGRVLGSSYLEGISSTTADVSLVTADTVVASTLPGTPTLADLVVPSVLQDVLSSGNPGSERVPLAGDTEAFGGLWPLERDDHRIVGALLVQQPSNIAGLVEQDVGRALFSIALGATLLAALASCLFGARIARPIVTLTKAAERVRGGDLTTRVDVHQGGEVGVLGAAFNQMTEAIGGLTSALRSAAEEEVRQRSRLQTILQSMTDGVIAVDISGTVLAFNREAERMLGIGAKWAIGRRADAVIALEDPSGAPMPLPFAEMGRESVRGVMASLGSHAGSTRTPVVITSATVSDEAGDVMGHVAVVRDLTPEIEVERMKTEFLSNVSHELRTPLTPIKGYANLMIRREVPREAAVGFLERIVESTDRLERIVGMLVDFSAMEAGRLVPKAVPVDLGDVVGKLMVRWEGASPKHRFERAGFEGLPLLHLDQRLVPRAIDELIDNAVKFSPEGGRVAVSAGLDPKAPPSGAALLRITVSDEGIGIARDRLPDLAAGFVQVDASETREYGGLGLGLAYVRRIAESHGGYLEEPESIPGRGSSFTIVLPAGLVDAPRPARPGPAEPPEAGPRGGPAPAPSVSPEAAARAAPSKGEPEGLPPAEARASTRQPAGSVRVSGAELTIPASSNGAAGRVTARPSLARRPAKALHRPVRGRPSVHVIPVPPDPGGDEPRPRARASRSGSTIPIVPVDEEGRPIEIAPRRRRSPR